MYKIICYTAFKNAVLPIPYNKAYKKNIDLINLENRGRKKFISNSRIIVYKSKKIV